MLYGGGVQDPTGVRVQNLTVRNFSGDALTAGVIHCRPGNPCRGLRLQGVHVNETGGAPFKLGWQVSSATGLVQDTEPAMHLPADPIAEQ